MRIDSRRMAGELPYRAPGAIHTSVGRLGSAPGVVCNVVTRVRRPLALAGLLAFLYLYPFPYFEAMRSANELPRIYLTTAMVDEGRFAIDTGVRRHGTTVD